MQVDSRQSGVNFLTKAARTDMNVTACQQSDGELRVLFRLVQNSNLMLQGELRNVIVKGRVEGRLRARNISFRGHVLAVL